MDQRLKSRLMLAATIAMFAATVLLIARNQDLVFRDRGQFEVARDSGDPGALVFTWRSEIEAPMAARLAETFDQWKGDGRRIILDLHSPGGAIREGEAVIQEIEKMKRSHEVDTRVDARHACYSMCVPIFLLGEKRIAAANARFMFHEPSVRDMATGEKVKEPAFEKEMATRRYVERYFVNSPMDPNWRDDLTASWRGRDVWKTGRELMQEGSNVVTALE